MKNEDNQEIKLKEEKNKSSSFLSKGIWFLVMIVVMSIAGILGKDAGKYFTDKIFKTNNSKSQSIFYIKFIKFFKNLS